MQEFSEQRFIVFFSVLFVEILAALDNTCLRGFLLVETCKLYKIFFLQRLTLLAIFISTFLFSLTWQFNQFMMLMQALVLFILDSLDMLPAMKVSFAFFSQLRWSVFNIIVLYHRMSSKYAHA